MAVIYEVSQITSYLKEILDYDDLLNDLWVLGEVSNLRRPGSGHSYFTLRDSRNSIRCVLFRNSRGAEHLGDGVAVVAHGRMSIYEVRGDLQLIADVIQPEGVGELQMRLERLKLQLEREGLFDQSRKRSLPQYPKRVAVVTSPTGSVWHDIQTVIARRYPLVELLIAPAVVQGDRAAQTIAEAVLAVQNEPEVDALIVARGGGSLEDLWPFNEEVVARAVFASRVPVVSAVGHETDTTICDLVADVRAPTPSAAAEMVVPDRADLSMRLFAAEQGMDAAFRRLLQRSADRVGVLRSRADRATPDIEQLRIRIDDRLNLARTNSAHRIEMARAEIGRLSASLGTLSPHDTLRRGYSIAVDRDSGKVVTDTSELRRGARLDITLKRGMIGSVIESVSSSPSVPPEED